MFPPLTVLGVSFDLGLAMLLVYVFILWFGGWLLDCAARAHFRRAQRFAHTGFDYDEELDRYECPQGELLTLHTFDDRNKLAIYKAPASTCNECVLKQFCTPHDEGRRVYRSLTEFHETDVGKFHRALSVIALAVALVFCVGGSIAWWNKPGQWLLMISAAIGTVLVWRSVREFNTEPYRDSVQAAEDGWNTACD
jgi:hypothetical protein